MPSDREDLKFVAQFDGKPAIEAAGKTIDKINSKLAKLGSVKTKDNALTSLSDKLKKAQTEIQKTADLLNRRLYENTSKRSKAPDSVVTAAEEVAKLKEAYRSGTASLADVNAAWRNLKATITETNSKGLQIEENMKKLYSLMSSVNSLQKEADKWTIDEKTFEAEKSAKGLNEEIKNAKTNAQDTAKAVDDLKDSTFEAEKSAEELDKEFETAKETLNEFASKDSYKFDPFGKNFAELQREADRLAQAEKAMREHGIPSDQEESYNRLRETLIQIRAVMYDLNREANKEFDKSNVVDMLNNSGKSTADVSTMNYAEADQHLKDLQADFKLLQSLGLQIEHADYFEALKRRIIETQARVKELEAEFKKVNAEVEVEPTKEPLNLNIDPAKMSLLELIQFTKQAKREMTDLENQDSATQAESQRYNELADAYRRAKEQLEQLQGKRQTPTEDSSLATMLNTINQVVGAVGKANNGISGMQNLISTLTPIIQQAGLVSETALAEATAGISLVLTVIAEVTNALQTIIGHITNIISTVINTVKKIISIVRNAVKKIADLVGSIVSKIKGWFSEISGSAEDAFSPKNLRKALKLLIKYVFGVRSFFFLWRKLRAGVGEGIKNLVQFNEGANDTNTAITELRTSLLYMKNAWAAAFAPIINFVYPVLVSLMDLIARVGNAIARFVAALTGQSTVLQALRVDAGNYADSLKDAGGAAGSAAKKQEDLNDRLADFDDLNVLGVDKDKTTPSGGGGGGGADDMLPNIQDMFEQIETPFNSFAEKLRRAWEKAWGTGNGFDLGRLLATSLSEGLTKAHNWLTGEGHDKMMKIANLIGTTLDGALSIDKLGSQIGQLFADLFDFGLDFVDTVITPQRMYKIGVQIADAMNTAIPQILPRLGQSIGNLFVSAISGWYGWVTTADFKGWGQALADMVNQFIEQMNRTLVKGTPTQEALNGWEILGIDIQETAQGFINALGDAIANADWEGLGQGIAQLFGRIDFTAIWSGLSNVKDSIAEGAKGLWDSFAQASPDMAKFIQPFVTAISNLPSILDSIMQIVKRFMPSADTIIHWIETLPDKIDRIAKLIEDVLGNLQTFLDTYMPVIQGVGTGASNWVKNVQSLNSIADSLEGHVDNIRDAVTATPLTDWIADTSDNALIDYYADLGESIERFATGDYAGAIQSYGDTWRDSLNMIVNSGKNASGELKNVENALKGAGDTAQNVKGNFNFDSVTENIKGMVNASKTTLGEIPTKFTDIKNSADSQSSGIKDRFLNSFSTIKQESITSAQVMQQNFLLASETIKKSFIDTWTAIKQSISEGGDLYTGLTDGMNSTMKSILNAMINGINISITKPLQDISKSFNILRALDVNGARPFAGIPYLNVPTIPHLAQGAVIPPNREFMAVLGDQRSGTNIEAPLDTIKQAVAEVMGDGSNAQVIALLQQLISVVQSKNLTIGDREIGKANARYEAEQKLIKGTMI